MSAMIATNSGGGDVVVENNEYMFIEALEDGFTFVFESNGINLNYSLDKITWSSLSSGSNSPSINNGEKIYLKAATESINGNLGNFSFSKRGNVGGNILSLLFDDDFLGRTDITGYDYVFSFLFGYCTNLVKVYSNFLTPTTLSEGCYDSMFYGCSSLEYAPDLPATVLTSGCYCYMFSDCHLLQNAPVLPSLTLVSYCYAGMFYGCSSLNYIKALFLTTPNSEYTDYWVYGVSNQGTFIKNNAATWNVSGDAGVPNGWTIETV